MSSEPVAERLRERQPEIEQELLLSIPEGLLDPLGGQDAEYAASQREAIAAALDCALSALVRDPGRESSAPAPVVAQAQRSARHAVSLETVICLYAAGRELLGDIMAAEAENHSAEEARRAQTILGALLQRLIPVIARAHRSETERLRRSPQQRRANLVRKLVKGDPVDATRIGYNFAGWHIGLIATGTSANTAASHLAKGLGRKQVLAIEHDDTAAWGWLSGTQPLYASEIEKYVLASGLADVVLAVGEPGHGLAGWRMTHRQAQEAHRVALLSYQPVTTYSDVGLLAPWALDRAAAIAFVRTHLGPLDEMKGGGADEREALREIFKASHQIAPAASALKVDRGTLRMRLSRIERQLGFPLASKQTEIEVALRLEILHGIGPIAASSDAL
jgi:DNA-binding PucR family transcriptional regulator